MSSDQADRDAQQETPAGRDVYTPVHNLTVIHQPAAEASGAQPLGPLVHGTASDQVVVGDIPQQPPGFLPRPALLAQLNRAKQDGVGGDGDAGGGQDPAGGRLRAGEASVGVGAGGLGQRRGHQEPARRAGRSG